MRPTEFPVAHIVPVAQNEKKKKEEESSPSSAQGRTSRIEKEKETLLAEKPEKDE